MQAPRHALRFCILLLIAGACGACALHHGHGGPGGVAAANPVFIPVSDADLFWNQLIATVERYNFRIQREDRVRQIGDVITEGRLETFPLVGSSLLEPWRRDSRPGREKLLATLQTIRRRVIVRVLPRSGGYLVELVALKELEDLAQPENSNVGGATLRHDGTLVRPDIETLEGPVRLGWIPQGRDIALEQALLAELSARLDISDGSGMLQRIPAPH